MKKIAFLLVAVAAIFMVAGCSNYGATGNPNELTGTWTSATKVYDSGSSGTVAGTYEGTWADTSVVLPTATTTSKDEVTKVVWSVYSDTVTTTTTSSIVIGANGSYTKTDTVAYSRAARDLIPASYTGLAQTNGYAALTAGTQSTTTTETVTFTLNADKTYTRLVSTTTDTGAGTGSYSSTTASKVTDVYTISGALPYQFFYSLTSGYTQTAAPAGNGSLKDEVTDVTVSLVIASDGTYTRTSVTTNTITGPVAGTQKVTQVATGTITGANDSQKIVSFSQTNLKSTYIGTGSGINGSFPTTETSLEEAVASTAVFQYYLTKGTKATYLQLFAGDGNYDYTQPLLTLSTK